MAGLGTLKEVQTEWSIVDLYDSHEALDIKEEIETYQMEQTKSSL